MYAKYDELPCMTFKIFRGEQKDRCIVKRVNPRISYVLREYNNFDCSIKLSLDFKSEMHQSKHYFSFPCRLYQRRGTSVGLCENV